MTQLQIKKIIRNEFIGNYKSNKLNTVAKVVSKFINKYQNKYFIDGNGIIDFALQMYDVSTDAGWSYTTESLEEKLERMKQAFFISSWR